MYRPGVRYDLIARAAAQLACPVLANGNVHSPEHARAVLAETGARGLMIGRGAIRNPWLFGQIRRHQRGGTPALPAGREVLAYVADLWEAQATPGARETAQVQRMKKFMNFIGEGLDPPAPFLHDIRRVTSRADFFRVCAAYLDHDQPMRLEPSGSTALTDEMETACSQYPS
jgi:tRNA-dihydrouridine synthase